MGDSDVIVFANAGPDVGLGHLVRCSALTKQLRTLGMDTALWTPEMGISDSLIEAYDWNPAPCKHGELLNRLRGDPPKVAVLDSYELAGEEVRTITEVTKTVVLDELGDRQLRADVVVNNNVYADDIEYPFAGDVLRGPAYCMLRKEFCRRDRVEIEEGSILITIGGADLVEQFHTLVEVVVGEAPNSSNVTAIVGPYFEDECKLPGVTYLPTPDNLPRLMQMADIAVSGGGQTLYELAACGTPCVAAILAEDQRLNVKGMAERHVCLSAGWHGASRFFDQVREGIRTLFLDDEKRKQMRENGYELVDGRGTQRVGARIEQLVLS